MDTKLVILAGGYGTRISEESMFRPKPMIEIGGKPILWHIMNYYSSFGISNFIICSGYKSEMIKKYFNDFHLYNDDIIFDFNLGVKKTNFNKKKLFNWNVTIVDTGIDTMTGGRLKKISKYIKDDDYFLMTYGDGLSNININKQILLFKKLNKRALVAAVKQPSRFGIMNIKKNLVNKFEEKPNNPNIRINGGFFVLKPDVLNLIKSSKTIWEDFPLKYLAKNNNLIAYNHNGFWHAMDTLRDKNHLENLWDKNKAPWKIW